MIDLKLNAEACEIGDSFSVAANDRSHRLWVSRPIRRSTGKTRTERMSFERIYGVSKCPADGDSWRRIS
jgi:hypothetical protein